jgi:hypothetical protein
MKNGSLPLKVQLLYPPAILFILTLLPFVPQIIDARVIAFRDMTGIFIPFELTVRNVISTDGWLAPWNPFGGVGKPLLADPFAFMLYPPHILSRFIPVPYNFHVMLVFHHYMAALGMYLLARTLGVPASGAIISAVTFASGGYLLSCDNMTNALYSVSWFPFVIREVLLILKEPGYQRSLFISWYLVLSFLGGMPEVVLMEVVAIFLIALEQIVLRGQRIRVKTILVLSLGFLWSGVLLSPVLYLLFQYASQSGRYPEMAQVQFSSSLFDFLDFGVRSQVLSSTGNFITGGRWWNPLLSEYPLMIALYCGPLVFPALINRHSVRSLYWISVAIIIYILSLGDSGILLPVVRAVFPVIGFFRYPEKLLLGIHLLLSISCGLALICIWRKWRIAFFSLGCACLFLFPLPQYAGGSEEFMYYDYQLYYRHINFGFIFVLGIILILVAHNKSKRIVIAGGLQVFGILSIHAFTYPTIAWNRLMEPPRIASQLASTRVYVNEPKEGFPANEVDQALWRKDHLYQAWAGVFGIQNINTPSSLNLRAHDAIQEAIASSSKDNVSELFRSVGVSSVISPSELIGYESLEFVAESNKEGYLYSIKGAGNRQYFLDPGTGQRDDSLCSVESVQFSGPSSWSGRVSCLRPAVLVLTETAYPGWNATVDTVERLLVSTPYQLLGVTLNPGSHDVRFSFSLEGAKVYVVASILIALFHCLLIAQYAWQFLSRPHE